MNKQTIGSLSGKTVEEAKELLLLGWLLRHEYISAGTYRACKNEILYGTASKEKAK